MHKLTRPRAQKLVAISTAVVALAVVAILYMQRNPGQGITDTANNSARLSHEAMSTEDKHLNSYIVPEFITGISNDQLLALLPEAPSKDNVSSRNQQPLTLWQPVEQSNAIPNSAQIQRTYVVSDPALLYQLEYGQKVEFIIPSTGEALSGEISAQRATKNGVNIFDLELDSVDSLTGGHIVRGNKSTDIAVVTEQGSYTVTINNQTGIGHVIDNKDLDIYRQNSDVVLVPTDLPPTPEPSSSEMPEKRLKTGRTSLY